ncbi:amino acid racemase [Rhodoferax sp. GW822-FHT02A01]|uniref:aspartate/glutamate racemase family protein n=1 Tax=Rhodoferax sp. GW822-FHT02A01 TaxID=3141537 RepID=UPI00315CA25F
MDSELIPGLIGVLGGMGPMATVDFMQKVLQATPSATDQDHIPMVVSSIPQIPDRTAAFRGDGQSPLRAMIASGLRLSRAGAGLIVVPCNTAHLWYSELQSAVGLPMLHLVDAALQDAVARAGEGVTVGLLCTDATLASGLYVNRTQYLASATSVQWALPTAGEMLESVMPGIEAVKSGALDVGRKHLLTAANALFRRGAQVLVLGCTEIPLVLDDSNAPAPVVDATASLARRTVAWSLSQRAVPTV